MSGQEAGREPFPRRKWKRNSCVVGKLTTAEALRCRVRYMTDGAVLGSENFVNEIFERNRAMFGKKRQSGAREMREADWGGL